MIVFQGYITLKLKNTIINQFIIKFISYQFPLYCIQRNGNRKIIKVREDIQLNCHIWINLFENHKLNKLQQEQQSIEIKQEYMLNKISNLKQKILSLKKIRKKKRRYLDQRNKSYLQIKKMEKLMKYLFYNAQLLITYKLLFMSNQKNSYDNLIFQDEEEELQNLSQPKKNSQFLNRLHSRNNKSFEKTQVNNVTEEHRIDLKDKLKQTVGNSKYKFKYLFQIPQIINNSKLQSRKKTYEIFAKSSQLEQYYLQLKKTSSNSVNTIQSKVDYKDILSQISNNKVHDTYQHQNQKNNGVIYTNELWSQKLRNQISEQSRLKELSELLELNKIKMSYDEQLLNYEEYFVKKTNTKKETISDMQQIISTAFLSEKQKETKTQYKKPQTLNIQTYFKPHLDEQTQDYSTKHSRMDSRKYSQGYRPKSQEYSIFSRRASTFQKKLNEDIVTQFNQTDTPNDKLRFIIEDTSKENELTKTTVSKINNFLRQEKEDQENIKKQKIHFQQVKALNNAIKLKKQRETNSHISSSIT